MRWNPAIKQPMVLLIVALVVNKLISLDMEREIEETIKRTLKNNASGFGKGSNHSLTQQAQSYL